MSEVEPTEAEQLLVSISALQHVTYCERRAALVHVEREWRENVYTAEGRVGHARVDGRAPRNERRRGTPTARRVVLWSDRLGIRGVADVVEYKRDAATGTLHPYPVEYKRGRPRSERAFEIQLCAQALCLEEMMGIPVLRGALLFVSARRRRAIEFDVGLRTDCLEAIARARELFNQSSLPRATPGSKCRKCSMHAVCMPTLTDGSKSVPGYLQRALKEA